MSYTRIERETGLVEVQCPHGVGHPSWLLTPPTRWKPWMGTHGCDGCCSHADWEKAEKHIQVYNQDFTPTKEQD